MARALDEIKARKQALNKLGRPLARRCKSKCELCASAGVSLKVIEVAPLPEEPEVDQALMLCESCEKAIDGAKMSPDSFRFLEAVMWSELPVVQVGAVRLLNRLKEDGIEWAVQAVDGLYLQPEVEAWVGGDTSMMSEL